jgi:hypothetical protein
MADDRPMAGVIRKTPANKAQKKTQKKAPVTGRKSSAPPPRRGSKAPAGKGPVKKGPTKKAPGKKAKLPPALEVDPEVLEFIAAIDRFKKRHNRLFPSWSEILHVLRELGYRKA